MSESTYRKIRLPNMGKMHLSNKRSNLLANNLFDKINLIIIKEYVFHFFYVQFWKAKKYS